MAGGAHFVSFPDLLAKVYLAKTPTAFGKTLVPRMSRTLVAYTTGYAD